MTRIILVLFVCLLLIPSDSLAQERKVPKSIADATKGLQKIDGFVPLYWDAEGGRMLLEVGRWNSEMLYQISLPTGVGSNPIGLDRGQLGDTHVVFFERAGNKVLLTEPNYRFRALTDNAAERRAVEESFARSVIWGFKVEATEGERVLVDATSFFMRDAHGVADRLREAEQGGFNLDESRSAFHMPRTKGFPKNTEVETTLTFTSSQPGQLVRETVPAPRAVTVRQRHSFVELPDSGYRPRRLDPRVGVFAVDFYDYATPISEPLEKRWIVRHRLEKKDPSAASSEAVRPIVYYVDQGTPEPIRGALIEGAAWWNAAFEAAGFRDAFQVKMLPADADPMDVRYNMINWVHRSTRGWAYGSTVVDPRTGEVVRGVVTLDSQRARQDYLLGSGLVPPHPLGGASASAARSGGCDFALLPELDYLIQADSPETLTAMAVARIRQLSAHEVGHTLGLAHNFAASTYGRASVMDYPAPLVEIKNGQLDLSNAYAVGIGSYDKFAIRYAYTQFAAGTEETAELEKIVREGVANGMLFLSDSDARPPGAAHPLANLWDNGADPVAMLEHTLEVRRIGLKQFGPANIPRGAPLSTLEAKLLPLYLHHRYQLQAAIKSIGGVYYTYAVKTPDGHNPARVYEIVPAGQQMKALYAAIRALRSDELRMPQHVLDMIPPRAFGYEGGTAEMFPKRTDPVFDHIGAATLAADLVLTDLLEPHRASRMIQFNAQQSSYPHFDETIWHVVQVTWKVSYPGDRFANATARAVQSLTVTRLMDLAANQDASPQVRAAAVKGLRDIAEYIDYNTKGRTATVREQDVLEHMRYTRDDIERFLTRPDEPRRRTRPLPRPPGDPIGSGPQSP
ncbi:MAG TPA: zinc-dependent metalloprotease [Pyrinomonadaceae bacterium]